MFIRCRIQDLQRTWTAN